MNRLLLPVLAASLTLGGCITYRTVNDGITRARIGETVQVAGHSVSPVRVIEDSRCPIGTQCVWAGRLRLAVTVDGAQQELVLGQAASPVRLVEAYPPRRADTALYPDEYRFGFSPG